VGELAAEFTRRYVQPERKRPVEAEQTIEANILKNPGRDSRSAGIDAAGDRRRRCADVLPSMEAPGQIGVRLIGQPEGLGPDSYQG
jgi:hypothetical protein